MKKWIYGRLCSWFNVEVDVFDGIKSEKSEIKTVTKALFEVRCRNIIIRTHEAEITSSNVEEEVERIARKLEIECITNCPIHKLIRVISTYNLWK